MMTPTGEQIARLEDLRTMLRSARLARGEARRAMGKWEEPGIAHWRARHAGLDNMCLAITNAIADTLATIINEEDDR